MRRKINHPKRYKSYPKNVPRKLLKLFFELDCSVTKLAYRCNVNTGIISALLNDGTEPKSTAVRVRLYLSPNPVCKLCGRKIIQRTGNRRQTKPDFIKEWDHLPTTERHKVIQQYLGWKENFGG